MTASTPVRLVLVAAAASAGGAAMPRYGAVVAVWARPGPRDGGSRERALAVLRQAGFRTVPFRVDLRGLEL